MTWSCLRSWSCGSRRGRPMHKIREVILVEGRYDKNTLR